MGTRESQRGISLISIMLIAVVVIVFGLMAIRLFPVYYDSFVVSSIFSDVADEARGKSASEIRRTIQRRFQVNEIEMVSSKDVKITSDKRGGSDLSLHYEQQVPFIGNLGMIVTFDKHARVPGH